MRRRRDPVHHSTVTGTDDARSHKGQQGAAPAFTAADAFDILHGRSTSALTRQAFLLCGHRGLARRAVTHAFTLAWQRWPEVALDPDPAGWVRAATYQYALAPWRHFRLLHLLRHGRALRGVPPRDRALLDALLRLPRSYRAALLLHDGLGLSTAETAAEVEASTSATAGRLRHARAALAERVPELRGAAPEELPALTARLVRQLAAPQPSTPPTARHVRRRGSLRAWCPAAASLALLAALAAAAFTFGTPGGADLSPRPVSERPSAMPAPAQQSGPAAPPVPVHR